MVPFATAAAEYGAIASRGSFGRLGEVLDALASPSLETAGLLAAGVAVVVLAARRRGRLAFLVLLICAAAVAVKVLAP